MKTDEIRFLIITFILGIVLSSCKEEKIDPDKFVLPLQIQASRADNQIKLQWYSPLARYSSSLYYYNPNAVSADKYELLVSEGDTLSFRTIDEIDFSLFEYFYPENVPRKDYFFKIKSSAKGALPSYSNTVWLMGGANTEWDMLVDTGEDNTLNMGDISSDGSTIIYSQNEGELCCNNIYLYSLDVQSNLQEKLVKGQQASFSPDGKQFTFTSHFGINTTPQPTNLGIFTLLTNESVQLTVDDNVIQYPIWTDDDNKIYYLNVDNLYSNPWILQQYTIDNGQLNTLISADEMVITNRPISFDVSNLYFTAYEDLDGEDIYAYDLERETFKVVEQTQWNEFGPAISPNGKYMAFISDRSGREEIWIKNLESDKYTQLTADFEGYPQGKLAWSNDNNAIYFKSYYQENNGIFKVNVQP